MDSVTSTTAKAAVEHITSTALPSPPLTSTNAQAPSTCTPHPKLSASSSPSTTNINNDDEDDCSLGFDIYNTYQLDLSSTPNSPTHSTTAASSPASDANSDTDDSENEDNDDDDEEYSEDPSGTTLTLHADTTVHGTGNIVPGASHPLANSTRFSVILLAAINKLNAIAEHEAAKTVTSDGKGFAAGVRPVLNVNLVINAGLIVTGDRNVIGHLPMVVGRKRKSEEAKQETEGEGEDESESRAAKKVQIATPGDD